MRILHLLYESQGDFFGIGGVGVRAYEIYKRLKDRHEVTLLCKKYPGARDREIDNLKHVFVGTESRSLAKTLLSYAYHAALFVKRHNAEFDIIIEEFSPAIPTFLHAFSGKPVVLQVQEYTGRHYFEKYNPLYALTLFLFERLRPKSYANLIFVSATTAKRVALGSRKRIGIIPNAISGELLKISPEEGDYILYIGRIDICKKGLDLLIEGYGAFLDSFPNVGLIIAGDGRDRERFERMLSKLPEHVSSNIKLSGWVSGSYKEELIRRALFLIFPSRHESQPIAALEAMACGKAVVVSGIPEFAFVTENGAGISFKPGNVVSLAQSMRDMAASKERKEMGQRGRGWAKDFLWDRIAEEYEQFLKEISAGRR